MGKGFGLPLDLPAAQLDITSIIVRSFPGLQVALRRRDDVLAHLAGDIALVGGDAERACLTVEAERQLVGAPSASRWSVERMRLPPFSTSVSFDL